MYPWFLGGLVAIGVPIVIHLLQLRRPQRVMFTNTGFIREVELVTVRQRKLQHLLVLLARVLGVVALVLMFCQPFIPATKTQVRGVTVAVLVDKTPSMQVRGDREQTLFDGAVMGAQEIGKGYPATARFQLMGRESAELTQVAYSRALEELQLGGRDELAKLRVGGEEGRQEEPLYVFSDFQKNAFDSINLNGMGGRKQVVLVPEVGRAVGNGYVDSVWIDDAFVRVRTNVGLHIRVRNGGQVVATECPVKVFLGGRQVAAFRVTVPVGRR